MTSEVPVAELAVPEERSRACSPARSVDGPSLESPLPERVVGPVVVPVSWAMTAVQTMMVVPTMMVAVAPACPAMVTSEVPVSMRVAVRVVEQAVVVAAWG